MGGVAFFTTLETFSLFLPDRFLEALGCQWHNLQHQHFLWSRYIELVICQRSENTKAFLTITEYSDIQGSSKGNSITTINSRTDPTITKISRQTILDMGSKSINKKISKQKEIVALIISLAYQEKTE